MPIYTSIARIAIAAGFSANLAAFISGRSASPIARSRLDTVEFRITQGVAATGADASAAVFVAFRSVTARHTAAFTVLTGFDLRTIAAVFAADVPAIIADAFTGRLTICRVNTKSIVAAHQAVIARANISTSVRFTAPRLAVRHTHTNTF
jgi:hypothetical protein